MTNNTTSSTLPLSSPEMTIRLALYIASLIIGTAGGCVVLGAIFSKRSRKNDNDIFLINLAFADMSTIWFYVGVQFYIAAGMKGSFFCKHVWPFMSVPLCVSIFTISSMAVVRCRSVVFTWKPVIRRNTATVWVVSLWIAAVVVFIPANTVSQYSGRYCYLHWSNLNHRKIHTAFLFAVQYAIPLFLIIIAYAAICFNLKKYEGQVARENIRKENMEIIKALAIITVLFALLLLPLQVGWMLLEFGQPHYRSGVVRYVMNYADIFCILHSCLNPFVYGIFPKKFRNQYSKWSAAVFHCRRRASRRGHWRDHNRETAGSCDSRLRLNVIQGQERSGYQDTSVVPQETAATVCVESCPLSTVEHTPLGPL